MKHTIAASDVKAIHAAELAQGKTPWEARQGTRTTVQALIHEQNPTPYSDQPALVQAAMKTPGRKGLTPTEKEALRQHQLAQVTEADMIASEKARLGPDATHRDAHHFVQKQHQRAIWVEADRLVDSCIDPVARPEVKP